MTGPPSPKRQRTGEKEETVVDEKIQKVLENVAAVEEEINTEDEKMNKEIIKIESKYNVAKRPFYEKRSKLLRDIPGFWKQALSNHPFVSSSFSDSEEKALEALEDLDVTFVDEAGGFKLELTFGENAFFAKGKIWKEITYKEDGEFQVKTSGVQWKDSKEANEVKDESIFFAWLESTEGDQDIAETIKDDVWKNPVACYAADEDDSEDEEGDEEEGDDDEDEGEDEE